MDFFLRFKQKSHSEAYSADLQLQVTKRLIMVSIWVSITLLGDLTTWSISKKISMTSLNLTKLLAMIFTLVVLCYLRCNVKRVKRYINWINLVLDACLIYCQVVVYPLSGRTAVEAFDKTSIFVIAWSLCLGCYSIYYSVVNWWIRAIFPLLQISFYLIFIVDEPYSYVVILVAVECFGLYLIYSYIYERYQRYDFLEKWKIYENYEATRKIFDDIIQGIMIVDQNYKIIYSNRTIESMFHQPQLRKQNTSLERFLSQIYVKTISPRLELFSTDPIVVSNDSDESGYQNTLNELLESIKRILFHPISPESSVTAETCWWDAEHESWSPDKRNFFFKFTTSTFMHKKVIVINVTDTTDRDSLIAAQASSDYKSRLLSSVSHELRTPLNGSINFIEQTLNEETIPQIIKEKWLIPALRSNRLLLSLVNDILDFSQMHAGKLRLVFEHGNIVATARECIELLEIQASKKCLDLSLQNNLTPERETIVTDHNRLRQVILNLLSNAVKFTFNGGVKLTLDPIPIVTAPSSPAGINSDLNGVRVTCRDTGIGISPENQKKLFQAFEKLDLGNRASINAMGAGLGLIISNNLVQRLSPESIVPKEMKVIRFESKEEEGSMFYFDVYSQKPIKSSKVAGLEESKLENSQEIFFEKGIQLKNIELLSRELTPRLVSKRESTEGTEELLRAKTHNLRSNGSENPRSQISTAEQLSCKCPPVLIVDDDPFNLTALEQILSKLMVKCHWAFNGREAIQKIQARQNNTCSSSCQQYKIVFLDCSMPVLDGFETSKLLRQMIKRCEISDLRIVACTAFVQQSDEDKAKAAGMDAFCTKPIKLESIREKLKLVGNLE